MTDLVLTPSNFPVATGSLEAYVRHAYRFPTVSVEEERDLFKRLIDDNDLEAAQQLVMSHLRYVVRIAYDYKGYGLPIADLIQEGSIGLMKAIKRFDPSMGTRLVTFAIHWIKAKMHDFIVKNWRVVRSVTTKQQRKLFFNLRRMTNAMVEGTQQSLNPEQAQHIAEKLDVKIKDVRRMEQVMTGHDESFDSASASASDDGEFRVTPQHYLAAPESNPALLIEESNWSSNRADRLKKALAQLDPRSRDILRDRQLSEKRITLQVLAKRYCISAERIRQLEKTALQKLKAILTD